MADKGETSKDMESEASTSEVQKRSTDSCLSPSRAVDNLESEANGKGPAMLQVLKNTFPDTITRSISLEALHGSPDSSNVSSESSADCSKVLASTSSFETSFASPKSSDTLRAAAISSDDEDWNISRLDSLLHRYHNHLKKAKMDLEKIREVILSDRDALTEMTERLSATDDFVSNLENSENYRGLPLSKRNEIRQDLQNVETNFIGVLQVAQTEVRVDFENFQLLENKISKNLADTVECLRNAELKAMEHLENSSSSTSKLSLSDAAMWLNFAETSLNVTWNDFRSFLMHRKLNYEIIFHLL